MQKKKRVILEQTNMIDYYMNETETSHYSARFLMGHAGFLSLFIMNHEILYNNYRLHLMKIQRDIFFSFQLTDFDICVCLNSHDLLSHTRWPMSPPMTHHL